MTGRVTLLPYLVCFLLCHVVTGLCMLPLPATAADNSKPQHYVQTTAYDQL